MASASTLLPAVACVAVAMVLGWTGVAKVFGRDRGQARRSAIGVLLRDPVRAWWALRALGMLELAVAFGLLALPGPVPGVAAAVLGAGFVGYLAYARLRMPGTSCGCTGGWSAVTWRSFCRAGWVVLGADAAAISTAPWWRMLVAYPGAALGGVAFALAVLVACSAEADRWWLLPTRRLWVRAHRCHRRPVPGGPVPVEASVELVERSMAWEGTRHLVRSSLAEHWVASGWRILRYAGVRHEHGAPHPVSVLFAVGAELTADVVTEPAVRVAIVAEAEADDAVELR